MLTWAAPRPRQQRTEIGSVQGQSVAPYQPPSPVPGFRPINAFTPPCSVQQMGTTSRTCRHLRHESRRSSRYHSHPRGSSAQTVASMLGPRPDRWRATAPVRLSLRADLDTLLHTFSILYSCFFLWLFHYQSSNQRPFTLSNSWVPSCAVHSPAGTLDRRPLLPVKSPGPVRMRPHDSLNFVH